MDIASTIRQAAQRYGLDPDAMAKIAQIESGMNPNAANPNSSARGVFQFIKPTWQQYGNGADPLDPTANIDAGMRLTVDNRNALRRGMGREPTPGELYLAHQQGAGGALKMLRNPSEPVGGDAISLNGGRAGMTGGDFAARWTSKFDGAAPSPAAAQPAVVYPPPVDTGLDLSPLAEALQRTAPPVVDARDAARRRGRLVLN